jgi:hypothetical protein
MVLHADQHRLPFLYSILIFADEAVEMVAMGVDSGSFRLRDDV